MRGAAVAGLFVVLAVVLLAAVAHLPPAGSPGSPVHQHVAAHYVAEGLRETGAKNLVTAVLLHYRSLDTFGEVVVIFTAVTATLALLMPGGRREREDDEEEASDDSASPVVSFVVRLMAPFIALFGFFVLLKGHLGPGGGFQGGVILGALGIALATALGTRSVRHWAPGHVRAWIRAAGPLSFLVVGAIGLALTGQVLGYPAEPAAHLVRVAMMVTLELGIGFGGAALLVALFLAVHRQ